MKSIPFARSLRPRAARISTARRGLRRRWRFETLEARRLLAVDLPAVLDIDTNDNGILDIPEIQALSNSLDSGTYVFERLASGEYRVREASSLGEVLEPNETLLTLDFRGSVSGFKWNDLNGNGAREAGEPGVAGVRIYADLNGDGNFTDDEPSTFTGADGTYRLVLEPGVTLIREVTPPGTVQTFPMGAQTATAALSASLSLSADATASSNWHNALMPADVNGDREVTVVDAYHVVREWRDGGTRPLEGEGEDGTASYVDVNNDGLLGVADIWGVVNVLHAEGEAQARNDRPGQQTPDPFTVQSNSTQNVLPVLTNDSGDGQLTITGLGTLETGIVGTTAQGDKGGQITVQSGGQGPDTVLYTPRPDFFGIERFIYQIRDAADGDTDQAEVSVRVVPNRDFASFTFQAFSVAGAPITSVEQGEEFIVRVFVKDDRNNFTPTSDRGVFSAFLDVTYNEALLELVAVPRSANPHGFSRAVEFSPQYQELVSIDQFGSGVIDEAGATQTNGFEVGTQPLGPGAIPFLEARFRAEALGTATISGNPADDPAHQFIFFRPSNLEALDPQFIDFGQTTVTVTPPVGAIPDAFTRNEDLQGPAGSPLTNPLLDVLANDVRFDPARPLQITGLGPNNAPSITTPAGQIAIANNGQNLRLTPAANFSGQVTFTYQISDGVRSETATVMLTIAAVNDAPTAADDSYTTDNRTVLTIAAPGVLANDSDPEGDPLQASNFQTVSDLGAQVIGGADGGFTYDPRGSTVLQNLGPGESRTDTFTYTVSDGNGGQDTAQVRVLVLSSIRGAHRVEILPGQEVTGINFGNRQMLAGEAELDGILEAIASDVASAGG